MQDQFTGNPVFPPSLMIEGMVQTAGILAGEARGFKENVILAKIRRAEFDDYAHPGDQIRYDAVLDSIDERAAVTTGTIILKDKEIGRVELMFSHVPTSENNLGLPPRGFVFTEQFMGILNSFRDAGLSMERPAQ